MLRCRGAPLWADFWEPWRRRPSCTARAPTPTARSATSTPFPPAARPTRCRASSAPRCRSSRASNGSSRTAAARAAISAWTCSRSPNPTATRSASAASRVHAIAPTLYAKLPFNPRDRFHLRLDDLVAAQPAGGQPRRAGEDGAGTDRALQEESRQILLRLGRRRHDASSVGRDVQDDGRGRHACTCPIAAAAPATQDLLAGQIHMMFDNIPGALTQARAGKVRAARRHLGQAHAGGARYSGDRRDPAGLRHRLVDHPDRPCEAAARRRRAAFGAVEEGAGERGSEGQVLSILRRRPGG